MDWERDGRASVQE